MQIRHPFNKQLLTTALAIGVGLAATLSGCSDDDPYGAEAQVTGQPMALGSKLVLLDSQNGYAYLIDAAAETIESEADKVELPVGITATQARAGDHDELLLLSAGRRANSEKEDVPATLTVLTEDGDLRSYEVGSPFDTVRQSPDGRYALLSRNGPGVRQLNLATEVAMIDLEAAPADGVNLMALSNLGETPRDVVFSPPMVIAGETRRLAVLFGARKLAILDLNHPGRRETAVELTSDLDRQVSPQQVLFDPTDARLFIRASGAADMYALRLQGPVDNPGGNDFRPTIDLIDVGGGAAEAALTVRDGEPMLIGASGASFTLVDVNSGRPQTVQTPLSIGHVAVVELPGEEDDEGAKTELLLWGQGAGRVIFGNLEEVLSRGDRALELSTDLNQGLVSLHSMPDGPRLLGVQSTGLTVIDMATRSLTPLTSRVQLAVGMEPSDGGSGMIDRDTGRVWVAPPGETAVSYLDLATGATGEVVLDAPTRAFALIPDAGRIAVMHGLSIGYITFLEADAPKRDTAQAIRGFLVADLLD